MVEAVQQQRKQDSIRLLLGGLHLLRKEPEDIRKTVTRLVELKVELVNPAHCSGDKGIEILQSPYGQQYTAGAGRLIVLDKEKLDLRVVPERAP